MSFRPLQQNNISTALLGTADPTKFVDVYRKDVDRSLFEREIHGSREQKASIKYTLIIIVISAIIFVTVIAIYDVFRNIIIDYFAKMALEDPRSHNRKQEIESTIIANNDAFKASIAFSLFCIITAIILVYILIYKFL
jgi:hypothetical protein